MAERTGVVATAARLVISTIVFGAALFVTAGTTDWPAAWALLVVLTIVLGTYAVIVARMHPGLAEERLHPPTDAKKWDKPLVAIVGVVTPAALIVLSGLDHRFHWTPDTPAWLHITGLLFVAAGGAMTNWAVAANKFFSALIRIQYDRGHQVVDSGPYRFVRHPAYTGSVIYMAGWALALGSRGAMAVAVVASVVVVVRTALEDRTLLAELEGYVAYAAKVRYRLLPGLW